ncbi:MAG: sulfotransferase domain-containing protein [Cyanobacteria bacterium J06597_1]
MQISKYDRPVPVPSATVVSPLNYALVVGPGRSGTTWLCQILNTYDRCLLKYEPFQSMKPSPYLDWKTDIPTGDIVDLRARFDALCQTCNSAVDMPPFLPKQFRRQNRHLLRLLFSMGKRFNALNFLYEGYGRFSLTSETTVLIKDVNFPGYLLSKLCDVLDPLTIALVRNPFATLASFYKGRDIGLHPDAERSHLVANIRDYIDRLGDESFAQYRESLAELSGTQLHALHWRLLVEPLVSHANTSERARVVVYEHLCQQPEITTAALFQFLGWEMGSNTRQFIADTTSGNRKSRNQQRAYFSVYRNPQSSLEKWKQQLSKSQQEDIWSIVRESPVMTLWPELSAFI